MYLVIFHIIEIVILTFTAIYVVLLRRDLEASEEVEDVISEDDRVSDFKTLRGLYTNRPNNMN